MDGGLGKMKKIDAEQLIKERIQRVKDAMALKEPDRVPITPMASFYAPFQMGMTCKEAMYKQRKSHSAAFKIYSKYEWDLYPPGIIFPGVMYDMVGFRAMKWPGAKDPEYRLSDDQPYQAIEKEWMKAEDYEEFFIDPSGYLLHNIVTSQNSVLESFKAFPTMVDFSSEFSGLGLAMFIALNKGFRKSRKHVRRNLLRMIGLMLGSKSYKKKMMALGKPLMSFGSGGLGKAAYDIVADSLRGMRGAMIDMYKRPEELKKACHVLNKAQIAGLDKPGLIDMFGVGSDPDFPAFNLMPLHKGADGFMSNKQFEEFYWPYLTQLWEAMIKLGKIPMPFFEGSYNDRLEYLEEFAKKHKGKIVYYFDNTDIIKVKEMMGDYVCIKGNIPASLFIAGTPKNMEEYVKKCIEGCKEGGGYIVDGGVVGIPNQARHENVQAMTDAVHKYGVYRK